MKVHRIGDWTLEDRLAAGGSPRVVLFLESGGPDDRLSRTSLRRLAEDHPEAGFYEIDLTENPGARVKYSLAALPLAIVFVNGIEVARHSGARMGPAVLRALAPCRRKGGPS